MEKACVSVWCQFWGIPRYVFEFVCVCVCVQTCVYTRIYTLGTSLAFGGSLSRMYGSKHPNMFVSLLACITVTVAVMENFLGLYSNQPRRCVCVCACACVRVLVYWDSLNLVWLQLRGEEIVRDDNGNVIYARFIQVPNVLICSNTLACAKY